MQWELALIVVVVVLAGAAVAVWSRRRTPSEPPTTARRRARPQTTGPLRGPEAAITLDVAAQDPDHPSVERLVRSAAARVLRTSPDVNTVVVEDRAGQRLGTIERDEGPMRPTVAATGAEGPPPAAPPSRRARGSRREPAQAGGRPAEQEVTQRVFSDRFELPDAVRTNLRRPDDPVDLVRAILEAANLPAEVDGHVIRSGDEAVIVAGEAHGSSKDALTQAFLRFQKSGAAQGLVISLSYVNPRDVERRRALAPNLRYAGSDAIQHMADAVALGGDPLIFATDAAD